MFYRREIETLFEKYKNNNISLFEISIETLAGQYFDAESDLHYNYHRYYDPSIGRYIRPDPIGLEGGINLYSYVRNNPINYIDSLGLRTWSVGVSLAVGLGLGGGGGTFINVGHDPSKSLFKGWSFSLTGTAEGGAFGGVGGGTQFQFTTTDACDVSQLTGKGLAFGQAAGVGIQGGVEYVTNVGGSVKGASYYLGFGIKSTYATPVSSYAFMTTTSPILTFSQAR